MILWRLKELEINYKNILESWTSKRYGKKTVKSLEEDELHLNETLKETTSWKENLLWGESPDVWSSGERWCLRFVAEIDRMVETREPQNSPTSLVEVEGLDIAIQVHVTTVWRSTRSTWLWSKHIKAVSCDREHRPTPTAPIPLLPQCLWLQCLHSMISKWMYCYKWASDRHYVWLVSKAGTCPGIVMVEHGQK